MRVLITGLDGFVGRHLQRFLEDRDSSLEVFGCGLHDHGELGEAYRVCDITDAHQVEALVSDVQPHQVYHLAGMSHVPSCEQRPDLALNVNVLGTMNLLKACSELTDKPRFLLASSAEVYGPVDLAQCPITEQRPCLPQSVYGASKLSAEIFALQMFRKQNLPVLIARSFNHFGPGQRLGFVFSDFCSQIASLEQQAEPRVMKVGDLRARRDFLSVYDVLEAYFAMIHSGRPGCVYNVCSGQAIAIEQILNELLDLSDCPIEVQQKPAGQGHSAIAHNYGSYELLNKHTDWQPRHDFSLALKDCLDSWRSACVL